MNFSEQPPSKQWALLKYRGEKLAEVWFKPEGEPFGLTFRIPQKSFQIPGMRQQLTIANLLRAVGITIEEVESWRHGDDSHSDTSGANPELANPLPPPSQNVDELEIYIRLKPPSQESGVGSQESDVRSQESEVASQESEIGSQMVDGEGSDASSVTPDPGQLTPDEGEREITSPTWQDLEARWKAIIGLEATLDTLRISMEGLQTEMEGSLKKTLTTEEKVHARRADVAQWNKAKSRVHHALPKVREFIHRSVWALGTPERKQLEELYRNHIQPQIPCPRMDKVFQQLENMQKDRQILSGHGTTVYHECKSIAADVQNALRTLQSNAAANAYKKKGDTAGKGKFFKQLRRWSGAG
jgi:uncharacterized protein YoxC